MPIQTDIHLEKLDLAATANLEKAVRQACVSQASRNQARKLVATFEAQGNLILVFELAKQDEI